MTRDHPPSPSTITDYGERKCLHTSKRLDLLLVERGLFPSREQAQRSILAGEVYQGAKLLDKPGQQVRDDAELEVRGGPRFVSRGGEKLAGALAAFPLTVAGRVCLDLGASTGGFTDCLLQHGAARVIATDVGRGQLAWKLREDPRVTVMEGVNARYLKLDNLLETPSLITIDVSFISLRLVLPAAAAILPAGGDLVALIKPQFEAGRAEVGKRGVVRKPEVHASVIRRVLDAAAELDLSLRGLTYSPLRGPEGNIEFLAWWSRGEAEGIPEEARDGLVEEVVARAHGALGAN